MVSDLDRFRGCLLGGAVGDALGGPIEFDRLASIQQSYGGMVDLLKLPRAAFTDDTQMTLFTAEGLIRTNVRTRSKGIEAGLVHVVFLAYLRWLQRLLLGRRPGRDGVGADDRGAHGAGRHDGARPAGRL